MFRGVVFAQQTKFLEQLHQLVHKFFHFTNLKSIFSILHTYFYKTLTLICLFYTFIQIKYSFLYPHSHRPTLTIHTDITPESIQPTGRKQEKQTQQNGSKPTPESTPRLEQQDRRLRWRWRERETRSMPPKASDGDGDGERHSTRKQRETKEERAIGGGGSGDGDRWKLEEERLMGGRKIDQMRGRKKEHIFLLISCKMSTFFHFAQFYIN